MSVTQDSPLGGIKTEKAKQTNMKAYGHSILYTAYL
jgi:hypothetical protein